MSLRYALLGLLSASPMTGYDVVQYFQRLLGSVWSAPQSQIYPELRRLEGQGLVDVEVAPRGKTATKRVYSLTDAGLAELKQWVERLTPIPPERDPVRLKMLFGDFASHDAARKQFRAHVVHYERLLELWEDRLGATEAGSAPLVRRILARRPPADREDIVRFRTHAIDGLIARARAEIAWALRGLAMIDELDAQRARRRPRAAAGGSTKERGRGAERAGPRRHTGSGGPARRARARSA